MQLYWRQDPSQQPLTNISEHYWNGHAPQSITKTFSRAWRARDTHPCKAMSTLNCFVNVVRPLHVKGCTMKSFVDSCAASICSLMIPTNKQGKMKPDSRAF